MDDHPEIPKSILVEIATEKDARRQIELWEMVKSGQIKKRDQLRKERKGLKKKDLKDMDADHIWEVVKRAIRKDKQSIKKLINASQLEKLLKDEEAE